MDGVEVWLTPAQLETLRTTGTVCIPGALIKVQKPRT